MKNPGKIMMTIAGLIAVSLLLAVPSYGQPGQTFAVTITNITRGQVISPPVVISHNEDFSLFELGEPASPGLVALAEDAIVADLTASLDAAPSVLEHVVAGEPLPPGGSVTLEITTRGAFQFVSAAGMLITTNDAFFAIRNTPVRPRGEVVHAVAYDAGSETNSEDCTFIPGPPCGNAGVRDTENAEGYVHVHAGIHGIADLVAAEHDWRNPVAEIRIVPVRGNR